MARDISVEILKGIRADVRATREELREEIRSTRDELSARITDTEVRLATEVVALAGAVRQVSERLAEQGSTS